MTAYLNPVNPSIAVISMRSRHVSGWEASQVLKTRLDQPGTMSRSREGPRRSRTEVTSKMTVTYPSPYGVWRHTCSSTPMTRTPTNRAGSLISRRIPSARAAVLAVFPDTPRAWRRAPPSDDGPPRPSTPCAPPHARAWHADRPLGSCLDASHEHTLGTVSGARSHARSWGATRRARAPSASPPCHEKYPGTRSVDPTDPHRQFATPTLHSLTQHTSRSLPGPGYPSS